MWLHSTNATLKLCFDRLYSFIMYFRNTMGMAHYKNLKNVQVYLW